MLVHARGEPPELALQLMELLHVRRRLRSSSCSSSSSGGGGGGGGEALGAGCRIMLTEAPMNPTANRRRMLETMFERYGFDAAFVQVGQCVRGRLAACRCGAGVVADVAWSHSTRLPLTPPHHHHSHSHAASARRCKRC